MSDPVNHGREPADPESPWEVLAVVVGALALSFICIAGMREFVIALWTGPWP